MLPRNAQASVRLGIARIHAAIWEALDNERRNMKNTLHKTEAPASVMAAHLAQSPEKQAPVGAQQTVEPDEATLAAMAAYQAKVAERKARNKDRTRILLGAFAATAVIIAVWNLVVLAVLFPVLVGALIVAGRLWAGWTGEAEDEHISIFDHRHKLCMSAGPADEVLSQSPWSL